MMHYLVSCPECDRTVNYHVNKRNFFVRLGNGCGHMSPNAAHRVLYQKYGAAIPAPLLSSKDEKKDGWRQLAPWVSPGKVVRRWARKGKYGTTMVTEEFNV